MDQESKKKNIYWKQANHDKDIYSNRSIEPQHISIGPYKIGQWTITQYISQTRVYK